MKRILTVALLMLAGVSFAVGQETNRDAKIELNEGARQYREGNFVEAQRRFEKALELDPTNMNAPLFIARAIHSQYHPGVASPENVAIAEAAIEAYKKALERIPDNDDSFNAVAYLYRQLRNDAMEREWLLTRATNDAAPAAKRADAYAVLAGKEWNCSFEITEQPENKTIVRRRGKRVFKFLKPKNEEEFNKASRCASSGLELIEQAIQLHPENTNAWAYRVNLLREMAKLAEMERNYKQRDVYSQQADEAFATHTKLSEDAARRKAAPPETPRQGEPDEE